LRESSNAMGEPEMRAEGASGREMQIPLILEFEPKS
jgi:hypothetical protein